MSLLQWQRLIGGFSGAFSVAAGAYGSHGLSSTKNQTYTKIFNTGVSYQLLHSALLLATPSICGGARTRAAKVSGALLTVGIILFSGSCYVVGLTEDRKYGRLAPVGGFSMIGGWLSLALLRR